MVVKIQGRGILDLTSATERHVEIEWNTDRKVVNNALRAPLKWSKDFTPGTDSSVVIVDFKAETKVIVETMLSKLNNNLVDIAIEEDVVEV